jgi:hypothetical protein
MPVWAAERHLFTEGQTVKLWAGPDDVFQALGVHVGQSVVVGQQPSAGCP